MDETDSGPAPDLAEIARIERLADPLLRNLQITLAYCRLSRGLGRLLGSGHANWCTFATWASKRAGVTIRGEDLRARLLRRLEADDAFDDALDRLNGRLLSRRVAAALGKERVVARVLELVDEASAQTAAGNLKVFAELAPEFSGLLARFGDERQLDPARLADFVAHFRRGPASEGGQDLLRSAFSHYVEAAFEPDPESKAELILLANVQVGLHEQTRLQPNIAGALEGPIRLLGARLVQDIRAKLPFWLRLPWLIGLAPFDLDELLAPFLAVVSRIWREEATRYLMELPVPGEVLGLGWDVPMRPGQPMFPDALRELRLAELLALLREVDRTRDTTVGSGAGDWTSLADRMNYIADLFRARHQEPSLYGLPFSADQCRVIRGGEVPSGAL